MKKISKKQVTASLDRMANLFQTYGEQMGVPSRVAFDFAYRCDLLSDALDKMAKEEGEEEEEKEEESSEEEVEEKEEKESSKKARLSRAAALRKLDRLYSKIAAEEESEEEESEEEEKESSKKARLSRAAAIRELDRLHRKATRRNRRLADFDPNEIGEEGKNEEMDADEEYMDDFDGNKPHHELSDVQESDSFGKAARLRRSNRRASRRRSSRR